MAKRYDPNSLDSRALARRLSDKIGLEREECRKLVDAIFETISHTLATGEHVQILRFGTFRARHKSARHMFDFKINAPFIARPRRVAQFVLSPYFRMRINRQACRQ